MRVVVFRSVPEPGGVRGDYTVTMNTSYANRVLGHLRGDGTYCHACQEKCVGCRQEYRLAFFDRIAAVYDMPATLPAMLDEPEDYLPAEMPEHDVLLAIAVHEEIVIAQLERWTASGTRPKGLIVPIEGSDWISPYGMKRIGEGCADIGVQVAFPKPFCSFDPEDGILLALKEELKIGRPSLRFHLEDDRIVDARVQCSAPCGATYYVARNLRGVSLEDDVEHLLDALLSAYPCTASHDVDREFNDSIIHRAVRLQRRLLDTIPENVF